MAGPWEKYQASSGPWEKYGAPPPADSGPAPVSNLDQLKKIGSEIMGAPTRIMDAVTQSHPIDAALNTVRDLTAARKDHWKTATEAYKAGDYKTAAEHAIFSFPVIGPMAGGIAEESKTEPLTATFHALQLASPMASEVAPLLRSAGNLAGKASTVAKGAAGAVVDAATAPGTRDIIGIVSPRLKNALGVAARVKEAVGSSAPAGMEAAAREYFGKPFSELSKDDTANLEAILKIQKNYAEAQAAPPNQDPNFRVNKGAPSAGGPGVVDQMAADLAANHVPSSAEVPVSKPSGVIDRGGVPAPLRPPLAKMKASNVVSMPAKEAIQQAEAPALAATGTDSAPAMNGKAADIARQMFEEARKSGTIPADAKPGAPIEMPAKPGMTPEAHAGAARSTRADNAASLADTIIRRVGGEVKAIKAETIDPLQFMPKAMLEDLAAEAGFTVPKTAAAVSKLLKEAVEEIKRRKAK